jgi:Ca2+-binding RTX toxin-like protein
VFCRAGLVHVELSNDGKFVSTAPDVFAIKFMDDGAGEIDNAGSVVGFNGVLLDGSLGEAWPIADHLFNGGVINGNGGVGVECREPGSSIGNTGKIYGEEAGVHVTGDSTSVENSGAISSKNFGVEVDGAGNVGDIANFVGTIHGDKEAVYVHSGAAATVSNDPGGTIDGGIFCSADTGPNNIVNGGVITGSVTLGNSNDEFTNDPLDNGSGGTSGPVFGRGGNDRLVGGAGADSLHGGNGNDLLTGGGGSDLFYFDTPAHASKNVDTITDFTPGVDQIVLLERYFQGIGAPGTLAASRFAIGAPTTPKQHIIYHPDTGVLDYDANGSAPGGATPFAIVTAGLTLHNTDFTVIA